MISAKDAIAAAARKLTGAYAARDAELLLMHVLGATRAEVLAHPERATRPREQQRFEAAVAERALGRPIQHITGTQEFYGLPFAVNSDVLIPRPETEHLVEAVIAQLPVDRAVSIVDVGTGSGAIAVTLAHALPLVSVIALDISRAALDVAERNAQANGVANRVRFLQSDLLEACRDEQFDAVVSNPPYIADGERDSLAAEVSEHEPATALFAGRTGYECYERLIPQAKDGLRAGGLLAMEMGYGQSSRIAELLKDWREVEMVKDLQGIDRVVLARR